jgi:hypothetical protein
VARNREQTVGFFTSCFWRELKIKECVAFLVCVCVRKKYKFHNCWRLFFAAPAATKHFGQKHLFASGGSWPGLLNLVLLSLWAACRQSYFKVRARDTQNHRRPPLSLFYREVLSIIDHTCRRNAVSSNRPSDKQRNQQIHTQNADLKLDLPQIEGEEANSVCHLLKLSQFVQMGREVPIS